MEDFIEFSNKYLKWYNGLSKIVRILLCILWDVPSNLFRLSKSILKKNTLGIVLAIILMIFGGWILFIIDIICILAKDQVLWLDDLGLEEEKAANADAQPAEDEKAEQPAEVANDEQPEQAAQEEQPAEESEAKDGTVE